MVAESAVIRERLESPRSELPLMVSNISGSDYMSANYQASIYSTNAYRSSDSLEELVPKNGYTTKDNLLQGTGSQGKQKMAADGNGPVIIEQKKSYGIGGAGNIRRPSDVIYPPRVNADGTPRQSVWSSMAISPGSSPDGRRATFMNLFSKKVYTSEASNMSPVKENTVETDDFNVDMLGKKKVEVR